MCPKLPINSTAHGCRDLIALPDNSMVSFQNDTMRSALTTEPNQSRKQNQEDTSCLRSIIATNQTSLHKNLKVTSLIHEPLPRATNTPTSRSSLLFTATSTPMECDNLSPLACCILIDQTRYLLQPARDD